jgi:crotonobetainyl-CoA:carnitine CoA-transferase CaiB-like acyl-CoA transferase
MVVPYQVFLTRDHPIFVASANQNLFGRLCKVLGLEEMLSDPRFKDNPSRVKHRDECLRLIQDKLLRWTREEAVAKLHEAGVPCAPVNNLDDLLKEDQIQAIDTIIAVDDQENGTLRLSGLPFHLDGNGSPSARRPPRLGEHTRGVLEELGLQPAEIDVLFEKQVVAGR